MKWFFRPNHPDLWVLHPWHALRGLRSPWAFVRWWELMFHVAWSCPQLIVSSNKGIATRSKDATRGSCPNTRSNKLLGTKVLIPFVKHVDYCLHHVDYSEFFVMSKWLQSKTGIGRYTPAQKHLYGPAVLDTKSSLHHLFLNEYL